MLSFLQFLAESEHSTCPYRQWGVVHPKTGRMISGDKHPEATTHGSLKRALATKAGLKEKDYKDWPEYAHVKDEPKQQGYMMVRGLHKRNAPAVLKSFSKLPHHPSEQVLMTGHHFYHEGHKLKGNGMLRTYVNDPDAKFDRK